MRSYFSFIIIEKYNAKKVLAKVMIFMFLFIKKYVIFVKPEKRKNMKKKLILLFFAVFFLSFLQAQRRNDPPCGFGSSSCNSSSISDWFLFGKRRMETSRIVKYKVEYLQGEILDHSPKVTPLILNRTQGLEFAVEFPKYGGKPWHFYYHFPTVGWGFRYLTLGNPDFLGDSYTFYPYINLPLIQGQLFSFNIKMGGGVAFLTEKFNKNTYNPSLPEPEVYATNNFAISTSTNLYLDLGVNAELKLSKSHSSFISRFSLTGDIGLNHFSNGSVLKPNTGLNMLTAGVGIKYSPYLSAVPMRMGVSRMVKKFSFEPVLAVGTNRQHISDSKQYLNASLQLGAYRPISNIYRMGIGVDLFYNNAFFEDRVEPEYYAAETNQLRAGLCLANELMFGDFVAGAHVGAYLVNQIEHDGRIYFKFLAKYRVYDHWFVTAAIKTHMEVAQSIEFGVGYSFVRKDKAPYTWIPEKPKKEKDPTRGFLGIKRKSLR